MAKLANISGAEAAKAFERAGWARMGQVGSHLVLTKPGVRANLLFLNTGSFRLARYAP